GTASQIGAASWPGVSLEAKAADQVDPARCDLPRWTAQTVTSTFRQQGMPDTGAVSVVDGSCIQHAGSHAIRAGRSRSQVAITFRYDACLPKKDKVDCCSKDQTMKLQPSATAITNITLAIQNTCQSILATPMSAMKLTGMNVNS